MGQQQQRTSTPQEPFIQFPSRTVPTVAPTPSNLPAVRECRFPETNFLGGGLSEDEGGQGIITGGEMECDIECRKRPKCKFWTFVGKWQVNCYLKSHLGEKSAFEGGVSGAYGNDCGELLWIYMSSRNICYPFLFFLQMNLTSHQDLRQASLKRGLPLHPPMPMVTCTTKYYNLTVSFCDNFHGYKD